MGAAAVSAFLGTAMLHQHNIGKHVTKCEEAGMSESVPHNPAEVFGIHFRRLALTYRLVNSAKEPLGEAEYFGPPELESEVQTSLDEQRALGEGDTSILMHLHTEAAWHLQSVNLLLAGACDEDTAWRLEWQRAFGRALIYLLERDLYKCKDSFEREALCLYDCEIDPDYASQEAVDIVKKTLKSILPAASGGTLEAFNAARKEFMIPEEDYEQVFRNMLAEVVTMMEGTVPLGEWTLVQEYYKDPNDLCEAYCEYKGATTSLMKANIARPIDLCKAQQLSSHEFTHHVQFCLAATHLLPLYPEFQCDLGFSPWGFILEAGAEVAVDALFTAERRKTHLQHLKPATAGFERFVEMDRVAWREMWRLWTAVARDLGNGCISKDDAEILLLQDGLKSSDSWPNAGFMATYGAYILGYGWGSELMRRFLAKTYPHLSTWEAYIKYMKRPVPPSVMWKALQ